MCLTEEVVVVGYVRFVWPSTNEFTLGSCAEISWIMKNISGTPAEESKQLMKSIPRHGIEFVTWFLQDINERWMELIGSLKFRLERRVRITCLPPAPSLKRYSSQRCLNDLGRDQQRKE